MSSQPGLTDGSSLGDDSELLDDYEPPGLEPDPASDPPATPFWDEGWQGSPSAAGPGAGGQIFDPAAGDFHMHMDMFMGELDPTLRAAAGQRRVLCAAVAGARLHGATCAPRMTTAEMTGVHPARLAAADVRRKPEEPLFMSRVERRRRDQEVGGAARRHGRLSVGPGCMHADAPPDCRPHDRHSLPQHSLQHPGPVTLMVPLQADLMGFSGMAGFPPPPGPPGAPGGQATGAACCTLPPRQSLGSMAAPARPIRRARV